jgi:hypothetical protein
VVVVVAIVGGVVDEPFAVDEVELGSCAMPAMVLARRMRMPVSPLALWQ